MPLASPIVQQNDGSVAQVEKHLHSCIEKVAVDPVLHGVEHFNGCFGLGALLDLRNPLGLDLCLLELSH